MDRQRGSGGSETARDVVGSAGELADSLVEAVKPRLRGWLHLGMAPISLAAAIVLIVLAPDTRSTVASVVFGLTGVLLFGTSAAYHRSPWGPRVTAALKRFDHANIFLIIAGTYTPFAVLLLPADQARTLLWVVWGGAIAGVLFRVFWIGAPRLSYTLVYLALGWVAVFYLVPLWRGGGTLVVSLIIAGGLLYTLGAVAYAAKRPDPAPSWFGYHEVFHAFTIAAFASHWTAALLAVLMARGTIV